MSNFNRCPGPGINPTIVEGRTAWYYNGEACQCGDHCVQAVRRGPRLQFLVHRAACSCSYYSAAARAA